MARVHFILQGKGGVGKTYVSTLLAQYMQTVERPIICFDTDPVNASFFAYKAFPVNRLELLDDGSEIDSRSFDTLVESIVSADADTEIIIDNGAATFLPLGSYLAANNVAELLASMGHELILHNVLTGGQARNDTVNGLGSLLETFPDLPIFVWLNEFWGPVEAQGKDFEQWGVYKKNIERIRGLIRLKKYNQKLFGDDLTQLLSKKMTFEQGLQSTEFSLMPKQRLKMIWTDLFNAIQNVNI